MESPDSKKPITPVPIWKPVRKGGKKRGKPDAADKRLTIIGSVGQGALPGKRKKKRKRTAENEASAEEGTGQLFRQLVNRGSSHAATEMVGHPRLSDPVTTSEVSRIRWALFYLKLARRHFRRFHARFTLKQILGFYIGVPAGVSLILCLAFFLTKPPRGVPPNAVAQRIPPAVELIQQIQTALQSHDPAAANGAVAELEKFYPQDPRTFVASGTVHAHEKRYDEARKAYLHALDLAGTLPAALINLGEIEFAVGNYAKAAEFYRKASRQTPHNLLILFRLYLCYSLLNDASNTAEVRKELAKRPDSLEWYFVQASEALRNGKNSEAQRLFSTARTMFGEQASAYQESLKNIGWLK